MTFKYLLLSIVLLSAACSNTDKTYTSPAGYDLNQPEKFDMPSALNEISGIAFINGNSDTVYAEQDEDGKLFHFKSGDKKVVATRFGKKGDYEDLAIMNGKVFMLRSDGTLFAFPLADAVEAEEEINTMEWKKILPPGEYEGLYANESGNQLYALCKSCGGGNISGTILNAANDSLAISGNFELDSKTVAALLGDKKLKLHPSALSKSPLTKEWYILSSVNKLLVVADENWKAKAVYPLNSKIFNQPEGMAFDNAGNLYISNEMGESSSGTLLKFKHNN